MRYARQELYKNIGKQGQLQLSKKHVVIVGVGALGSVAADLLCRAGVGKLTLIDRDYVEEHNLQRQSLYTEADVGQPKAVAALTHLKTINSGIKIVSHVTDVYHENVHLLQGDLIVDGTDNMETRFLINEYATKHKLLWVYGSAIRDEGYVKAFLPGQACFRCLFKPVGGLETCDTSGVINSITHIIASLQVSFTLQLLLGKKVSPDLFHINAWTPSFEKLTVKKNTSCPVCKGTYDYLSGKYISPVLKFCGSSYYQIRGHAVSLSSLVQRLRGAKNLGTCVKYGPLTIFPDGRVLIVAKNETEARALYTRYLGA
ncbi:ThiF family adenylyltransferase [Candidatus Woesearchaeota archaeon]|nr:ThiF family adenylyltransferase [Candidatus Woesearchaeota archaeon]